MSEGRTKAVGVGVGEAVGLDWQWPGGKQDGDDVLVGDFVGWVGCVGPVDDGGALVVGADDDGRTVWCVAGGRVGAGAWSVCLGGTLAGGGNCSTGTPSMSAFITAVHVAVG